MWSKGQLTFVARSRQLVAPLRGSLTFWRVCAPVRHPQMKMTSHILHLCNFCTITWSGCLMLCSKFYLFLMFGEPRALWLYFSVTMWLGHGGSYWDHIHVQLAIISELNRKFPFPSAICARRIKYSMCTCAELGPTSEQHCLSSLMAIAFLVQSHWFSTVIVPGAFGE